MIGQSLERHTPLYNWVLQFTSASQDKNTAMKSKELDLDICDENVARHRSGRVYKTISKALPFPRSTLASIIVKQKTFGTTRTECRLTATNGNFIHLQVNLHYNKVPNVKGSEYFLKPSYVTP